MNNIEVKVTLDKTKEVSANAEKALKLAIKKACFDTQAHAQNAAPVDTGNLKNSIQTNLANINNLEGEVKVGAEYGIHVEFGTSRMHAQPFITPAADIVGASFVDVVAALINADL